MAKNNNKKSAPKKIAEPVKPDGIEFYFDKYAAAHQDGTNQIIQVIAIPLLAFAIFGLVWAIPFPYIKFLGRYNADFNWSSFLIAFCVYYYMKFSRALAYITLFILLAFSYIATDLVDWQQTGGRALWQVCGLLLLVAAALISAGYKKEGKKLSFEYRYKNLLIAPLYLLHLVFRRFKIRY